MKRFSEKLFLLSVMVALCGVVVSCHKEDKLSKNDSFLGKWYRIIEPNEDWTFGNTYDIYEFSEGGFANYTRYVFFNEYPVEKTEIKISYTADGKTLTLNSNDERARGVVTWQREKERLLLYIDGYPVYFEKVNNTLEKEIETWNKEENYRKGNDDSVPSGASTELELVYSSLRNIYNYNYPSVDYKGEPIILSASLAVCLYNASTEIKSVFMACHATITSNFESPSNYYKYGDMNSDVGVFSLLPYTGGGSDLLKHPMVIMPDYEGYGITADRAHPYLNEEVTSRQVIDGVMYGLKLYQKLVDEGKACPLSDDWKSFCVGYSQGGAVALSSQRYIEKQDLADELHFVGTLCGDGPYDPIATLRYYFDDDGTSYGVSTKHRKEQLTMPVVLPLIIKGMLDSNLDMQSHKLTDFFSKQFLDTGVIKWLEDKKLDKNDQKSISIINKLWYDMCESGYTASDGTVYSAADVQKIFVEHRKEKGIFSTSYYVTADLKEVMTPQAYEYLKNTNNFTSLPNGNDPMKDLHRALIINKVSYNWAPKFPVVFAHSKYDMVVPYGNYQAFSSEYPSLKYRIRDSYTGDHLDTGTAFFLEMIGTLAEYFQWLVNQSN